MKFTLGMVLRSKVRNSYAIFPFFSTSHTTDDTLQFTLLSFRLNNPSWRRRVIATVEYPHNWICVVFPATISSKCFPLVYPTTKEQERCKKTPFLVLLP